MKPVAASGGSIVANFDVLDDGEDAAHSGHVDWLTASTHALALRGCEASPTMSASRSTVNPCARECLCAAPSGAADERFKHAATVFGQEGPG